MEKLVIAGQEFGSRLFLGTGKFSSYELMQQAIKASRTEMVTVAMKRIELGDSSDDMLQHIVNNNITLLPNTSGVRNAEEAVFAAQMSREAFGTPWLKLEIHPDPRYLLPDSVETLKATEQLVKNCVKAFQEMPHIPKTRLVSQTADIHIQQSGISHMEREMRTMEIANDYQALPDIITAISDETLLTPATVNRILVESGRCGDFLNNPEAFLEQAVELIRSHRHALAIDGIRYAKLDGQEYYVQEIFDTTELLANLDRNAVKVEHSVYDYVVYDSSTVEKPVAVALDNDPDVKMFFKIPSRFKIETPIGTYNPDWAVYLNKNGEEKLYFVLETKGDTSFMHLKTSEQLKIHCGKEHFKALDAGVELETATSWTELRGRL